MNSINHLTDEEFVSFLKNLGVETYNQSFEWMIDSEFSGVMRWLYNNLDHHNALSPREEYRYAELQKKGLLLPPEDLESEVNNIQTQFPGICLPGDKESLEYVKLDISMQKEKLLMLKKQEEVLKNLITQNRSVKDNLSIELSKLESAKRDCNDELSAAAEECKTLAVEVENITDVVLNVIADKLDVYANCHVDTELAHKFLIFGPLDAYRQTQALFKSHFDLYTSKNLGKQSDMSSDEDLRMALVEAKSLEEKLTNALFAYVESEVDLSGEQAKLALVTDYTPVHPSQATSLLMEVQTSTELLSQEETILMQQIQDAIQDLVNSRTKLVLDTATKSALAVREQILHSLSSLLETSQQALAVDRLLYCALRHELKSAENCVHFALQLRQHVETERDAVKSRILSMKEIISEQQTIEQTLESSDVLLETLYKILGSSPGDALSLVKMYAELQKRLNDCENDVAQAYRKREDVLEELKSSLQPLKDYIYDGCTKAPSCWNSTVSSLSHSLKQEMERVEQRVVDIGSTFTSVKNNDKKDLRKLWQWFLTDKSKLLAAVKGIQSLNDSR